MVKTDQNKIEIYSQIDKNKIKKAIKILFVPTIMSVVSLFLTFNIFWIFLLCISSITLIIGLMILRMTSDEPKLQVVLTKQYVEIYKRKGIFKIEMNRIISFSYDTLNYNSFNEVFINYKNNNKKTTKIFILRGMKNNEFCKIANTILKEKESENLFERLHNIGRDDTLETTNDEQTLKILCYIGKKKLGDSNDFINELKLIGNNFYFINKEGKEFAINRYDIELEDDIELKTNSFYAVKFDKDKTVYTIQSTDFKFDFNIVENYKNRKNIKSTLIFDDKIINEQINILDKFKENLRKVYIILMIPIAFGAIISRVITGVWKDIIVIISVLLLAICFMVFGITILKTQDKIRKVEGSTEKNKEELK